MEFCDPYVDPYFWSPRFARIFYVGLSKAYNLVDGFLIELSRVNLVC